MSGRGRGKGLGKGGAKWHRKVLRDNVIRDAQDLLRVRDSRCYDLHRARSPQDCYCHGCCLCFQEVGQGSLWFWRLRRLELGFSIWVMFQIRGFFL